jgi:DNA polymerase-3 subunit epsilon
MRGVLGVHWDDLPLLRERAASFLSSGPARPPAVAEEIFGLRCGPPDLAASLVREVLRGDPRFRSRQGRWLLRDGPDGYASVSLGEVEFVVVDVEATGGAPARGDRLTEVAAVRVRAGRIVGTFESLVNPQRPIPPLVTRLTNITDDMVSGAPTFADVADPLKRALEGAVFVAHNVAFDWRVLRAEFERCQRGRLGGERLCTLRLARRLHPELPRRSLQALADHYAIAPDAWHRAGPDARTTAELLLRFLDALAQRGIESWGALQAFLKGESASRRRDGKGRKDRGG